MTYDYDIILFPDLDPNRIERAMQCNFVVGLFINYDHEHRLRVCSYMDWTRPPSAFDLHCLETDNAPHSTH